MPDDQGGLPVGLGAKDTGVPVKWKMRGRLWTFGRRFELSDGAIAWNRDAPHDGRFVVPEMAMLGNFARLGRPEAPDEEFLAFARRWGALGLCEIGAPLKHNPFQLPFSLSGGYRLAGHWQCRSGVTDPQPIGFWRYWAAQAATLLAIAADLRADSMGPDLDRWQVLWAPAPWAVGGDWEANQDVAAEHVADMTRRLAEHPHLQTDAVAEALDTWLWLGGVRPAVRWTGATLQLTLRPTGLFDTLGLMMALVIADVEGVALCRHCQTLLTPARRLGRQARGHFCDTCRQAGWPSRYASRAYRERKAADPAHREREATRARQRRSGPG